MKRKLEIKHERAALLLIVAMMSCVGVLSAQTQGTGNRVFTVNQTPLKMVFVQGGEMQLGCNNSRDDSCYFDETPVHVVKLQDYYIGETEITQAQWIAVMGRDNNPSYWKGNTLPVERVSWAECQRFINRLNKYLSKELPEGYRFALPSEAQWEYAARGGMKSAGARYAGGNDLNKLSWFYDNSDQRTHDVRVKSANELGVFDMSGNVWEWCQDFYYENYYTENQDWNNPINIQENSYYVLRGGSWNYAAPYQRCAKRDYGSQHSRYEDCGFRVALVPR